MENLDRMDNAMPRYEKGVYHATGKLFTCAPQAGCSKRPSSKAARESKPAALHFSPAHPKVPRQLVLHAGYVEDFDEPRTQLADFFSIRLNLHPLNFFIRRHQLVSNLHHQLKRHIGFL